MIGNDIVDLKLAGVESNWKRAGFLDKLFGKQEQEAIFNSEIPEIEVWKLWAMKEAAYKAHQRLFDLPRSFHPKKLLITHNVAEKGIVAIDRQQYILQSNIMGNCVHSVAILQGSEKNIVKKTGCFPDIKAELIRKVANMQGLRREDIGIKKNRNSVPYLFLNGKVSPFAFSLAHHGKYSAFAVSLTYS